MKRRAVIGALLCIGCLSSPPPGAILALVDFAPDTTAKCIEVVVRTPTGTEVRSTPVPTDRKRPVKVGIAKASLPDEVLIYAVGYSDAACVTQTVPPERTEDGDGTFKVAHASTVALRLARRPNAIDADGDGYASLASGGDDCDDTDPSVHPGALEACGDGKDNDCDRATDCEDDSCSDQSCGLGAGARCKTPACIELSCLDGLDNDRDGLTDCEDPDCVGAACANGGRCEDHACRGASTEKDLCADQIDNDGDGKIDCDDPHCLGSLCNPGTACLTGTRCDANKTCAGGTPVVCVTANVCMKTNGSCDPVDGGCTFVPDPGKPCDDKTSCTDNDACSDAGVCVGRAIGCVALVPCLRADGCSADAGCIFVAAMGDSCDDGNNCTSSDQCLSDAGCAGTAITCAPSGCQLSTGCAADGGCLFSPSAAGAVCDGGVCNSSGACIHWFPYPPSNFTESQLPTPGTSTTLNCVVTLDSDLADGGVGFGGWCGNTPPPFRVIAQAGAGDAVLLSFSNLDLAPDASVRLQGDRPVIFAATGNLLVEGELVAGAGFFDCRDGGAGGAVSGNRGGGGGGFGSPAGPGGNAGGAAGIVNGDPRLIPLRGGCPGGNGARGGGAVQLSAAGMLSISGVVGAPGLGGSGGSAFNGGEGAGSGGAVLLEGLYVLTGPTSAVTANGGSGGEGGGVAARGAEGGGGSLSTAAPASGGTGASTGAKGGDGAAGTMDATGGGDVGLVGGGGGGAGVGRTRINSSTGCSLGGGVLSPKPTTNTSDAGC